MFELYRFLYSRFSFSLLITAIIFSLNFFSGIIVARVLGPEGRGVLVIIVAWPTMLAGISLLALSDTTAYFVTISKGSRRLYSRNDVAMLSRKLAVITSFVGSVILLVIVNLAIDLEPEARTSINSYMFLMIFCNHFSQAAIGYLQGNTSIKEWNFVRLCPHLIYAILCIIVAFLGGAAVHFYAIAMLTANAVTVIIGLVYTLGTERKTSKSLHLLLRPYFNFAFKLHFGRIFSIFRSHADKLILSLYFPPIELGYYICAYGVAFLLSVLTQTFFSLLQPICTMFFVENCEKYRLDFVRLSTVCFGILGLATFVIYWASPWAILYVFGDEFRRAIDFLPYLVPTAFLLAVNKIIEVIIISSHQTGKLITAEICWVLTFLGCMVLLPNSGGLEVARAMLLASVTLLCCSIFVVRLELGKIFLPTKEIG